MNPEFHSPYEHSIKPPLYSRSMNVDKSTRAIGIENSMYDNTSFYGGQSYAPRTWYKNPMKEVKIPSPRKILTPAEMDYYQSFYHPQDFRHTGNFATRTRYNRLGLAPEWDFDYPPVNHTRWNSLQDRSRSKGKVRFKSKQKMHARSQVGRDFNSYQWRPLRWQAMTHMPQVHLPGLNCKSEDLHAGWELPSTEVKKDKNEKTQQTEVNLVMSRPMLTSIVQNELAINITGHGHENVCINCQVLNRPKESSEKDEKTTEFNITSMESEHHVDKPNSVESSHRKAVLCKKTINKPFEHEGAELTTDLMKSIIPSQDPQSDKTIKSSILSTKSSQNAISKESSSLDSVVNSQARPLSTLALNTAPEEEVWQIVRPRNRGRRHRTLTKEPRKLNSSKVLQTTLSKNPPIVMKKFRKRKLNNKRPKAQNKSVTTSMRQDFKKKVPLEKLGYTLKQRQSICDILKDCILGLFVWRRMKAS